MNIHTKKLADHWIRTAGIHAAAGRLEEFNAACEADPGGELAKATAKLIEIDPDFDISQVEDMEFNDEVNRQIEEKLSPEDRLKWRALTRFN